jgi:ectoine hydroxylase-related dioxygenase (phytanoyl-CoA dioxygenase family)
MKVQIYLDDTTPDDGAFGYVPGSHLENAGPYPLVRDPDSMPGHRVYGGHAGSAILFNSYGMHTSMVNRSGRARRSIILIYEVFNEAIFSPEQYQRFADRLTTPERRQLFRLERRP